MMDRIEQAKKFYAQAQKMTAGMALSVLMYGAIGYYLIRMGKAGPSIMSAQTYLFVKYIALGVAVLGVFAMWQLSCRKLGASQAIVPVTERSVQKVFLRTVVMNAGAELPLLLGMLLVFFGRQPFDYIPFAIISLVGFILAFPRKQEWVNWLGVDF